MIPTRASHPTTLSRMQKSPQVVERNQLLVVGSACYLLWCVLLELLHFAPVQANTFLNPHHRTSFIQSPNWTQNHQRHLLTLAASNRVGREQVSDHEANQRAIASLSQLIGAHERAPHLWNMDFLPQNIGGESIEQEPTIASFINNINLALPPPQRQPQQEQQFQQSAPPANLGSTAPSVNRQLMAPPAFYELPLAPTNALQLETNQNANSNNINNEDSSVTPLNMQLAAALTSQLRSSGGAQRFADSFSRPSLTARSLNGQSSALEGAQQDATGEGEPGVDGGEPKQASASNEAKNSFGEESAPTLADDKAIEPRQRRRIFNRILKKAEWNHLFVELSKVFLKYFLDLALKDIIGKQSGAETTTSRKKLDAQSELTDLLKDFFKTAISNI